MTNHKLQSNSNNPSTNLPRKAAIAIALAAAAATLTGCASSSNKQSSSARLAALEKEIRSNPTPELATRHERTVDQKNALTLYFDVNLRSLAQDAGRFWYTDRPSRLTREPSLCT